jgi:AcrR family transcriptional regulator
MAQERVARMALILDSAEKLFVEKGYAGTSINDIAEVADFSRTSIYQYFGSKEEIYLHILERHTDRLTDRLEQATAAVPTVSEKIRAFLDGIRDMKRENPNFFELYFIQRHQVEPRLPAALREHLNAKRRRLEDVFREFYRKGVEKGEVRAIRFKDASNLFFAQIMGMMLLHEYYEEEFDVSLDDHLDMSLELYLAFIEEADGRGGKVLSAREHA